jgi:hypothetical protein
MSENSFGLVSYLVEMQAFVFSEADYVLSSDTREGGLLCRSDLIKPSLIDRYTYHFAWFRFLINISFWSGLVWYSVFS